MLPNVKTLRLLLACPGRITTGNQVKSTGKLNQSLADFDDRSIQHKLNIPKLAFAGEKATIIYGENFGNVTVDMVGLLKKNRKKLTELGWDVEIFIGSDMDHTKAMQPAAVLPLIKPWFMRHPSFIIVL